MTFGKGASLSESKSWIDNTLAIKKADRKKWMIFCFFDRFGRGRGN
jgi:hypothetical protein